MSAPRPEAPRGPAPPDGSGPPDEPGPSDEPGHGSSTTDTAAAVGRLGPAEARQHRAWRIVGPLFGAVWVVFLSEPLSESFSNPDPVRRWLGVLGVLMTAVGFVLAILGFLGDEDDRRARVVLVGLQVVGVVLACVGARQHGLVGLVFVGVTFVYIARPARGPRPSVGLLVTLCLLVVVCLALPRAIPGWETEDSTVAAMALACLATYGFSQLVHRNRQLQLAQEEVAALAVSRERERIARDMHDVLGHSLTVISVKSELAARLVPIDAERAAAELVDIQSLARSALADVRGMVTATRHLTLAGELAAARRAFDAGGIDAQLPGAVDAVPERLRELFAWTVREATTNVLRHAAATRVVVTLAPDRIVVEDDGRGAEPCPDAGAADPEAASPSPADLNRGPSNGVPLHGAQPGGVSGHGLVGLRERAAAAGATLTTGPSTLGGFRLMVRAPRSSVGTSKPADGKIEA